MSALMDGHFPGLSRTSDPRSERYRRHSRELHSDLVDIAPAPVLAGLERGDDRMLRRMVVLGRVLVLRVVATADVAAGPAQAKVHPGVAGCEALLAAGGVRSVR